MWGNRNLRPVSFPKRAASSRQSWLSMPSQPLHPPLLSWVLKKKSNSSFRMNQGVMKIGRNKGSHVISSGISVSLRVEFLL